MQTRTRTAAAKRLNVERDTLGNKTSTLGADAQVESLEAQLHEFALPRLEVKGAQPGLERLFEHVDLIEAGNAGRGENVLPGEGGGLAGNFAQVHDDAFEIGCGAASDN
jgi:hypothetical protein